jgi:hypothetical protein
MMQTELLTKRNIATISEEITPELGAQFIKDFQQAHPTDVKSYVIGKDMINQILAQPGCAGIKFYNALNELGQKTLVYVGLNADGQELVKYTSINGEGALTITNGLIADRVYTPQGDDFDSWGWGFTID